MPLKLHCPGPDDYSKGWEVSEVRESVSESNRGGPVTILFVLRAWDRSLVFDTMRASMGPRYSTSHKLFSVSALIPLCSHLSLTLICASSFVVPSWPTWFTLTCTRRLTVADIDWSSDLNSNLQGEYFGIVERLHFKSFQNGLLFFFLRPSVSDNKVYSSYRNPSHVSYLHQIPFCTDLWEILNAACPGNWFLKARFFKKAFSYLQIVFPRPTQFWDHMTSCKRAANGTVARTIS